MKPPTSSGKVSPIRSTKKVERVKFKAKCGQCGDIHECSLGKEVDPKATDVLFIKCDRCCFRTHHEIIVPN